MGISSQQMEKNTKNTEAREAKAQGIIKQIKNMLEEMVFEVVVVLRNSLFIIGILTNIENCRLKNFCISFYVKKITFKSLTNFL